VVSAEQVARCLTSEERRQRVRYLLWTLNFVVGVMVVMSRLFDIFQTYTFPFYQLNSQIRETITKRQKKEDEGRRGMYFVVASNKHASIICNSD